MPVGFKGKPLPSNPNILRAVGITCGIGSMLVGARQAGFTVIGNIEWRKYYHYKDSEGRNTFVNNFPGAFMVHKVEDLSPRQLSWATGCDLAIGHPECGLYSQMQGCNNFRVGRQEGARSREEKLKDQGDIPLFLDLIRQLRPRYFVMDDLPKSFLACPMKEYTDRLPEYDLFPEWISNYHYGNVQRRRIRMFMIGSLKSERFVFSPGEKDHRNRLCDLLGDLPLHPEAGAILNHDPHTEDEPCGRGLHMDYPWHRPTYGDYRRWMEARPEGTVFEYHSPHSEVEGDTKKKPGWYKQRWQGPCAVIDGGSGHTHPLRNLPFTIRERARIQGFPDDFVFYGTRLNENGEWNHEKNIHMVKQTGKAMPVQFCRYVSELIAAHIRGVDFKSTGRRFASPDPYVTEAKVWFCDNIGYADQESACNQCWNYSSCTIRSSKYGIGPEPNQPQMTRVVAQALPVCEPLDSVVQVKEPKARKVRTSPLPRVIEPTPIEVTRFGSRPGSRPVIKVEDVHLRSRTPRDYHCECRFCKEVIGELIQPDGSYYSRLERRAYYDQSEVGGEGHAAKTPLHIARWAIQAYTNPGDWVLDPTAGAGTTIVESLVQGRNAAGVELQYKDIIFANTRKHADRGRNAIIGIGDARGLSQFLSTAQVPRPTLVVNNPPYSGDEHQTTFNLTETDKERGNWSTTFEYNQELPNLAFLKEGDEYWRTIHSIYSAAAAHLLPGGHFVIGVKDMMRRKKPFMLHQSLCEVVEKIPGMEFIGTAFLKHYPGTLFLHTYEKMYGVRPPLYQTISVFRKGDSE